MHNRIGPPLPQPPARLIMITHPIFTQKKRKKKKKKYPLPDLGDRVARARNVPGTVAEPLGSNSLCCCCFSSFLLIGAGRLWSAPSHAEQRKKRTTLLEKRTRPPSPPKTAAKLSLPALSHPPASPHARRQNAGQNSHLPLPTRSASRRLLTQPLRRLHLCPFFVFHAFFCLCTCMLFWVPPFRRPRAATHVPRH